MMRIGLQRLSCKWCTEVVAENLNTFDNKLIPTIFWVFSKYVSVFAIHYHSHSRRAGKFTNFCIKEMGKILLLLFPCLTDNSCQELSVKRGKTPISYRRCYLFDSTVPQKHCVHGVDTSFHFNNSKISFEFQAGHHILSLASKDSYEFLKPTQSLRWSDTVCFFNLLKLWGERIPFVSAGNVFDVLSEFWAA